jgi:hypothetical protein
MEATKLEGLKSYLRAVGATPDEARAIMGAATHADKRPTDKTITTTATAAILECHPKTVFRYARRGLLNPIRRSARCVRWRESEVQRLAFGGAGA